jgi:hypothetical protein
MIMSYEEAAMAALIDGVRDGRATALREAPHIEDTLGFKPDTYTLQNMPIDIGPLPNNVLGVTGIAPEGRATEMRINGYIPRMLMRFGETYKKSKEWVLDAIRHYAKHTTEHESYHVMSAPIAKGEEVDERARDLMESVTTRGRYKMKKKLGKNEDAEFVRITNPYAGAWKISELADWVPYEGPSGTGYRGLIADASKEPFYRPLWRLTKAAAKAAVMGRAANVPRYATAS